MGMEVDQLLELAEEAGASDLFALPGRPPHLKVRGRTFPVEGKRKVAAAALLRFEKKLGKELRKRFKENGQVDLGWNAPSGGRYRLNLHLQKGKPALVARRLPSGELEFDDLGLPEELSKLAQLPRGLVLVTGAAGSGKSTTLAALLHRVQKTREAHIVTIEDPIEFVYGEGRAIVSQREVGTDAPTYAAALHNVLRQSPDVILIGEIRDQETMEVAVAAAMTGHLVMATLHTMGALQTFQRILTLFPDSRHDQLMLDLSVCLRAVLSLRLLPHRDGEKRIPATELLTITPGVARMLREGKHSQLPDLLKASRDPRLVSFNDSLLELYSADEITSEVALAYSDEPEELRLSLDGMRSGLGNFSDLAEIDFQAQYDIKTLLDKALEREASDLHLTADRPPMIRVMGELVPLHGDILTAGEVRWLLFSVLNERQRSSFELDHELDFSLAAEGGERFRVNAYYQRGQVAVALRTIPSYIPTAEELGLPDAVLDLADANHGLILMVGPTGVGKTTTVACLVDRINRKRACHILTIEDPIEYSHTSRSATVDQREVYSDTPSFASALKFVLRQDPDVIVVGEMRDLETISSVLTAAETGHLVIATLHTSDVCQTVDRIVDVFPPHQQSQIRMQLSGSLLGVVSQRLLPRSDGSGRVAAFEVMLANVAVKSLIRDGKTHQLGNIVATGSQDGMVSLDRSLGDLVRDGIIDVEEAKKFVSNPRMLGLTANADSADGRLARELLKGMDTPPPKKERGLFGRFKR